MAVDVSGIAVTHPGGKDVFQNAHGLNATSFCIEAGHPQSQLCKQMVNEGNVKEFFKSLSQDELLASETTVYCTDRTTGP